MGSINILLQELIVEGRLEDIIKKYSHKTPAPIIKEISANDPSGNNKYLDWMVRMIIDKEYGKEYVFATIDCFHRNQNKFTKDNLESFFIEKNLDDDSGLIQSRIIKNPKDVNSYVEVSDLAEICGFLSKLLSKSKIKQTESKKIYESDRFLIIQPLTHRASCYYGAGTQWCTTTKGSDENFKSYSTMGKLYYILDKSKNMDDSEYKVAFFIENDKIKAFNAPDKEINYKEFLSDKIELWGLFNIEYTINEKILFNIPLTKSEKELIGDLQPKSMIGFVKELIENNVGVETLIKLTPESVFGEKYDKKNIKYGIDPTLRSALFHNNINDIIFTESNEIMLLLDENDFYENYLEVPEDDYESTFLYVARYGDDNPEEIMDDEINRFGYYLNDENKEKFNELLSLIGLNGDSIIENDELINTMDKYFSHIYNDHINDLTYTIGMGITDSRNKKLKDEFNKSFFWEYDCSDNICGMSIDYDKFLELVLKNNINSFSDIKGKCWVGGTFSLNDLYYSIYDVSDYYIEEFNRDFSKMLDDMEEFIIEKSGELLNKEVEEYRLILNRFGFTKTESKNDLCYQTNMKLDIEGKPRTYSVYLCGANFENGMVEMSILKNQNRRLVGKYKIPIDKVGEYLYNYKLKF